MDGIPQDIRRFPRQRREPVRVPTAGSASCPAWVFLLLVACVAAAASGCSRTKYRLQADRDAYEVIGERNGDQRWSAANYGNRD